MYQYLISNVRNRFSLHTLIGILLLAAIALPAQMVSAAQDEAPQGDVSVMSFNIRFGTANDGANRWENRREMVCDLIGKYDCDVVGLQEALRFQIDAIRQAIPEYGEIGVGRDGKTKGEYSNILYRTDRLKVTDSGTFWLSDTPEKVASITWGNACTRVCTWARFVHKASGQAFYHFNTHLDHRSQPSREKSVVLIDRRIAKRAHPDPVILTGDFNAGESNQAVRYVKGDKQATAKPTVPLVDTFRVLHPQATEVGTFNQFKGDRSGGKIDYIFTLPSVKVTEAKILFDTKDGRFPSDHFPVLARLALPN